ncbi:hypothetical protein SETIT_4G209600v2 [Setaria italica]|uniref:Cytochrome P450 family protein n=1 Tax=Setaria italica TaxID=4555 RepID=A0A368QWF9_SETIT|nr:hypothetical protein SETIT_4G209600v2 [Setaria italica]
MFLLLSGIVLPLILLLLTVSKNLKPHYNGHSHPPSPWPRLPLVRNFFCHPPTMASLAEVLRRLHAAHGPVVSLWVGGKPAIFINHHDIARRALVHMGTTFARPPSCLPPRRRACRGRAPVIRRQARQEPRVSRCRGARRYGVVVTPSETFRHTVFGFFTALCFGEGVEEDTLRRLRGLHVEIISLIVELDAFHLMPVFLQVVCYFPRWRKLLEAQRRHHDLVTSITSARQRRREEGVGSDAAEPRCYVDTLLELGLGEEEKVSLCWEYMNAVEIQQKLRSDIIARRASGNHIGKQGRPFVEAVVLEALRLHRPAQYLLAHTTDKDVTLDKYVIPKGSIVNFGVASIGRDASLWTDLNLFRPERFVEGGEASGVRSTTGGGGGPETMKMIPFGAGRRACLGAEFAMTVLQKFVDDLVRRFRVDSGC